jgi:hypothetical protein
VYRPDTGEQFNPAKPPTIPTYISPLACTYNRDICPEQLFGPQAAAFTLAIPPPTANKQAKVIFFILNPIEN